MAGDEPKSDGVGFFGVKGWDSPLGGCALPVKLLARAEGKSWRRTQKEYKTILLTVL